MCVYVCAERGSGDGSRFLQEMTQDPEVQLKSKSFPPPEPITLSKDLGKAALWQISGCVEMVSPSNGLSWHGLYLYHDKRPHFSTKTFACVGYSEERSRKSK